MSKRSAKWIYEHGKPEDFTDEHIIEIIENLYAKNLAEAWFIGMGWVEGYHYCKNPVFVKNTFCPSAINRHRREVWFACTFLD